MSRRCCAQIVVAELGFLAALSSPPAACALVVAAARLLTEARTNAEGPEDQSWEASRIKLGVSAYMHPHAPKHSRERERQREREGPQSAAPFGTSLAGFGQAAEDFIQRLRTIDLLCVPDDIVHVR